jgi:hypothetical protein
MKNKPNSNTNWVEDPEEELIEEEEISISLPELPQLKVKARKQVKKFKLNGHTEGTNLHSKKHTKGRTDYR